MKGWSQGPLREPCPLAGPLLSNRSKAERDTDRPLSISADETKRFSSLPIPWLDRSLKDTNTDAARLLTLFLGCLIVTPSKEPPLSDGVTGFLWNRAQRMLLAEKKIADGALPPRLLYLDAIIRTVFLKDAFPKEPREGRKACLEKWEGQLISKMTERKGFTRDDFYRLMALTQLRDATQSFARTHKGFGKRALDFLSSRPSRTLLNSMARACKTADSRTLEGIR